MQITRKKIKAGDISLPLS
jgi:hypothetical protein